MGGNFCRVASLAMGGRERGQNGGLILTVVRLGGFLDLARGDLGRHDGRSNQIGRALLAFWSFGH